MDALKRKKLQDAGWQIGSADEFLELTQEESAYLDLKRTLSGTLRERRIAQGISQNLLAKRIGSSQSRIAKAEGGDPSVSLDLLFKALFAAGLTRADLAKAIRKNVNS